MSVQPADPGMAVKMAPFGLAELDRALAGEPVDEVPVLALCDFVTTRHDCADFRALALVRLAHSAPGLSEATRERIKQTLLGFRYWMDEQGHDSMCFWSENHQLIFATCEYLAGVLWPEEVFTNPLHDGRRLTGVERRARAARRIRLWLDHRFRFGFTEWLSNTYYEEDAAPLALLVDLAPDTDISDRATGVLDLLLLDLALHQFEGALVSSGGRTYAEPKKHPERADVRDLLQHSFGLASGPADLSRMSGLALTSGYRVPEAIRAIATTPGPTRIRHSSGLDLSEVESAVGRGIDRAGLFYWLMEAFTTPEALPITLRMFRDWRLQDNRFLAPLAPFARLPRPALAPLVRALNPATQGVAIQRANVETWRTPHGMLSSAQQYHPGGFGDQQHLWQATLPGPVSIFATHPGAPMFDETARNFSPSAWVGNGVNPHIAQDEDVLLCLHDLRVRRGMLEAARQPHSHLWWPTELFDDHRSGPHPGGGTWLAARCGAGAVGIISHEPLVPGEEDGELVQPGELTAWFVVLEQTSDLADLGQRLALTPLTVLTRRGRGPRSRLETRWDERGYRLDFGVGCWRDGEPRTHEFPRHDSPWVTSPREPKRIRVRCRDACLDLSREGRGAPRASTPLQVAVQLCDDIVAADAHRPVRPWHWGPALFGHALAQLETALDEPRYRDWLLRYGHHHLARPPAIHSSDTIAPALVTSYLQQQGHSEFAPLTDRALDVIRHAPRAVDDAVNHLGSSPWNLLYPRSVWVDSLMMFSVFPVTWGHATGAQDLVDIAAAQPVQYARRLQDPATGLWHHSYWVRRGRPHPETFWVRGNAWVVAALPMILAQLGQEHPRTAEITELLRTTSATLLRLQRPDGSWSTVLGRTGRAEGTGYRELSATALIGAGWLQSVRAGWLPADYLAPGRSALAAVTAAVRPGPEGLELPEVSAPTIPLHALARTNYLLTPRRPNLPHGVAAFVMAALQGQEAEALHAPQHR